MAIKNIIKYTLFFTLVAFSNLSYSDQSLVKEIIGAWKVLKDDDAPNKRLPHEIMSFWGTGEFCISRSVPYKGSYVLTPSSLNLTIKINNKDIIVNREYILSNTMLKFKNKRNGFVYYKKISSMPMEKCFGK